MHSTIQKFGVGERFF